MSPFAPVMLKTLFLPALMLCSGVALLVLTNTSTWRFAKAEAASYLFTGIGAIWFSYALFRFFTAVKPQVGHTVVFWGPDGRTKVEGRIVELRGDKFVCDTPQGQFTLDRDHFLKVTK